jgi:membrane protein DedA with SNARE-associated domain
VKGRSTSNDELEDAPLPPPSPNRTLFYAIPLGVTAAANVAGTAFMPYLLARAPLVLVLLSPVFRHLVLVSPSVGALPLFLVAVPRHFLPDPFMYFLGREYGPLAVEWAEANSPSTARMVRQLEKLFAKVGPAALLVSPEVLVSMLAGAARVPFPLFVAFNLIGTVLNVFVARWFGDVFERQIHAITGFFRGHVAVVTAVSVAVVLALNWYSRRNTATEEP